MFKPAISITLRLCAQGFPAAAAAGTTAPLAPFGGWVAGCLAALAGAGAWAGALRRRSAVVVPPPERFIGS